MAKYVLAAAAIFLALTLGYFLVDAAFVRTPCLFMHSVDYCDRP